MFSVEFALWLNFNGLLVAILDRPTIVIGLMYYGAVESALRFRWSCDT